MKIRNFATIMKTQILHNQSSDYQEILQQVVALIEEARNKVAFGI